MIHEQPLQIEAAALVGNQGLMSRESLPWIMRHLHGPSAVLDCLGELLVRFGMLDPPTPQKGDEVIGSSLTAGDSDDPSERSPGSGQQRGLTAGEDTIHQVGKTTCGILNRQHGFAHDFRLPRSRYDVEAELRFTVRPSLKRRVASTLPARLATSLLRRAGP